MIMQGEACEPGSNSLIGGNFIAVAPDSLLPNIIYFENAEAGFPRRLSRDQAQVVREAIIEIKASDERPTLIRVSA
jgi:hypothetical protein